MAVHFLSGFHARTVGSVGGCALFLAALTGSNLAGAQVATQADLSMVFDFGVSDIAVSPSRTGPVAGIRQEGGNGNLASIEQSGGNSLAEVWQLGDNNTAKVVQDGIGNELRLWQEGSNHSANITQIGSFNSIAAVQQGFGSVLNARQEGVGNQAAVVLMDESKLTFSQIGNYNIIEQTVPVKTTMQITQTGNGMDARLTPAN